MKLSKAAAIIIRRSSISTMMILLVLTLQVFQVVEGTINCGGAAAGVCFADNTFLCNDSADGCIGTFTGVQGTSSKCVGNPPGDVCKNLFVEFDTTETNNQGMTCQGEKACLAVAAGFPNDKGTVTCKGGTSTNPACNSFTVAGGCLVCKGPNDCLGNLIVFERLDSVTGPSGQKDEYISQSPTDFFQGTLGFNCPKDKKKSALPCFSSSNTVEVQDKGLKTIDSLEVGDYIKTGITGDGHSQFSRLMSHIHKDPHAVVEYLQIYTEDAPEVPLEISSDHFLYLNNNKVVRAKDVQVGDILKGDSPHMAVTHIHKIQCRGLYAPVTEDGTIWVSGVVASSYISLLDNEIVSPDKQVLVSHMALAPLRMICNKGSFSICKDETHSEEGYSMNLMSLIKFGLHFLSFDLPMQLLMLIVSAPVLLILAGLEMIMNQGIMVGVMTGGLIIATSKTNKITK